MLAYYFAILLPVFADLFWAASLATQARSNLRPQNVWIGLSLTAGVIAFIWAAAISGVGYGGRFYVWEMIEEFVVLMYYPFVYLYFRALTDERRFSWHDYLTMLPALLLGVANAAFYLSFDDSSVATETLARMAYDGAAARAAEPFRLRIFYFVTVTLLNLVVWMQMIVIMTYAVWRSVRYRRRLDEFFSDSDGKSLENTRTMIVCLFMLLFFSSLFCVGRYYYAEHPTLGALLMAVIGVGSYVLHYNVAQLRYTASELAGEELAGDAEAHDKGYAQAESVAENARWDRKIDKMSSAFTSLMDEEHIFLQSDLRLDDVARMMRTNRAYISRMINEHFGCSFSSLVNGRRIAWAQSLLRDDPRMLLESVAESSGFNHASAFSRMFRVVTGMTCRDWMRHEGLI